MTRGTSTRIMTRYLRLACQSAAGGDWERTVNSLLRAKAYAPTRHRERAMRLYRAYLEIWLRPHHAA